jgi:hypothetical protein
MTFCPQPNENLFKKIKAEIKNFEIIIKNDKTFNGGNLFTGPLSIIFFTVALFKGSKEGISIDCFRNLNDKYTSFDQNGNDEYVDDMMGVLFMNPQYILILALFFYGRNRIPNLKKNALNLIQLFKNHAGRLIQKKKSISYQFNQYDQQYGRENSMILTNHQSSPIINSPIRNSPIVRIQQIHNRSYQDNEDNDIFVDSNANHGSRSLRKTRRSVGPTRKWKRDLDGIDNDFAMGRYERQALPIPTARRNDIFVDSNAIHGSRSLRKTQRSVGPTRKWKRDLDGIDNGFGMGRYERAVSRGGTKTKRRRQ